MVKRFACFFINHQFSLFVVVIYTCRAGEEDSLIEHTFVTGTYIALSVFIFVADTLAHL